MSKELIKEEIAAIEQEAEKEASLHFSKEFNKDNWWACRCCYIAATTAERLRAKGLEDTLAHIMTRPGDWDEVKQLARRALANYRHPKVDKPVKTSD